MKITLAPEVESRRIAGTPGDGPLGAFRLTHPESGRRLTVIASDGRDWTASGLTSPAWEHVSVSTGTTCPRWEEMCWVKDLFWAADETVIEFHPAKDRYVNNHPTCLHLWRPVGVEMPVPPIETV